MGSIKDYNRENILNKLRQSKFRTSFYLNKGDRQYIERVGFDKIKQHASDFIQQRLAPAKIKNDGRQTPYRGHPVFKAQHATATCCRGCLKKWYNIKKYKDLNIEEKDFILNLIIDWIAENIENKI